MRTILKIIMFVTAVVVLGSLLAPLLYWGGRWLGTQCDWPFLMKVPFSRFFNRAVLIVALALTWPFLRWIGVGEWSALGLKPNSKRWRDVGVGLAVSIPGLWLVAGAGVAMGTSVMRDIEVVRIFSALGTGLAVAVIEECFFRGALFGVLRRNLDWRRALAFLSAIFATLHFIKPHPAAKRISDIHWLSGFEVLPHAFHQFADPKLLLVGWVTLFLFGWILGYTVVRTRSLYMAMGLHGGWVFALRAFMLNSKRAGPGSIWLGRDLTVGIVPVTLLLASFGLIVWLLRRRPRPAPE